MKFKFLLCIDDTDELGGEISTGLLAEEISALAGVGLRLSGNDGKIRGKFELKESNLSVAELLGLNGRG